MIWNPCSQTTVSSLQSFFIRVYTLIAFAVDLPSGSFLCDRRCHMELFSTSLHQASNLCTSHNNGIWHVRYVCNSTDFHH